MILNLKDLRRAIKMDIQEMIANARTLKETNIPELGEKYGGKVRDCYDIDSRMAQITTDRISAFDFVLSRQIPFKGQVLTEIMCHMGDGVSDILPYHVISRPDPQVVIVDKCKPFDVEFIIRGYITGSLWADYTNPEKGPKLAGAQYGIELPEGLKASQQFDNPIVTCTTKAKPKPGSKEKHHDVPVSRQDIVSPVLLRTIEGIDGNAGDPNPFYIDPEKYDIVEHLCLQVFERGQEMARSSGLILVDTKYEVGINSEGRVMLIDEVHTPDSSRYWHAAPYLAAFEAGKDQKSLSKEFVRDWLKKNGYDGKTESSLPTLTDEVVAETAKRYIELCETLTGKEFVPGDMSMPLEDRIKSNLKKAGLLG